jgi:hypothetical protein
VSVGRIILFIAGLVVLALPAQAEDIQPWPSMLVIAPLGDGWQASGELIRRVGRTSAFNPQHEYRAQLGRTIAPGLVLWAGYVHFDTYRATASNVRENQIVEQLNWTGFAVGALHLSSRTRLEQRFVQGVDRTAWRMREQVRLIDPVLPKVNALVWVEPFVALNRTEASPTALDQIRIFAGVALPITKRVDVEVGYLHQLLHRTTGNVVNHTVPVSLTVRL